MDVPGKTYPGINVPRGRRTRGTELNSLRLSPVEMDTRFLTIFTVVAPHLFTDKQRNRQRFPSVGLSFLVYS